VTGARRASARHGRRRARASALLALVAALVLGGATGQGAAGAAADGDGGEALDPELFDRPPAVFSVGLRGGLPSYRSVALEASVQQGWGGAAAHVAYGSAGVAGGIEARLYPPLPGVLPLYAGVGADVYAGGVAMHGSLGGHVLLGDLFRFDLSVGAARARLAGTPVWTPRVAAGVSMVWYVDLPPSTDRSPAALSASSVRCDRPPDPAALEAAISREVERFVRDGIALYGAAFRDLEYEYSVVDQHVSGSAARALIRYRGSAIDVVTGDVVSASGDATARFRWTGCRWLMTELRY
jgi:hypothetical protein